MPTPLQGLRVVEVATMLPGAYATLFLADLGADVIRVERPVGQGPRRDVVPHFDQMVNRHKRSLTLDLKAAAGKEVFRQLLATTDVLVEGFRPGAMARLGFGYEALRPAHPGLIYCSVTGFGQSGPLAARSGHDVTYASMAGVYGLEPHGETPYAGFPLLVADLASGPATAMAILAALHGRRETGLGTHLDVSMTDLMFSWAAIRSAQYLLTGQWVPGEYAPPPAHRIYRCADGLDLALGAMEEHFWQSCCAVLGHPEWQSDPRFATEMARRAHGATLTPLLAECFMQRPRAEWLALLEPADVPCAPVLTFPEACAEPYVPARGLLVPQPLPENAGARTIAFPIPMSGYTCEVGAPAPAPGAHTAAILAELGYDAGGIAGLAAGAVI